MNSPDKKPIIVVKCGKEGRIVRPSLTAWSLIFLLTWLVVSCATKAQIIREQSANVKPPWIDAPPIQADHLYFVGVSTSGETLEKARNDAMKDAVSKISSYLGTSVSSSFESISTESAHRIRINLKADSASMVFGATLVDTYYEKITRSDPRLRIEKFDVYVLMSFSKEKVAMEMQRQKEAKETKIKTARNLYEKGRQCESQTDYITAIRYYRDSLKILDEANRIIIIKETSDTYDGELSSIIKERVVTARSLLLTASFHINTQVSKEGEKAFVVHFTSGFSSKGFSITGEKPQFEVIADISSRQGGYVMNNHVSHASGSVTVIRKSDDKITLKIPFNTKGFHKDPIQSFINAMAEAGDETGGQVAESIMKQLNFD